jgi:hypothetical protein
MYEVKNLVKADMEEVKCSVCIIVLLAQESVAFIFIMILLYETRTQMCILDSVQST